MTLIYQHFDFRSGAAGDWKQENGWLSHSVQGQGYGKTVSTPTDQCLRRLKCPGIHSCRSFDRPYIRR